MDDLDKLLEIYISTLSQDNSPEEPPKSYSFMSRSKSMCRLQGKLYGI